MEWRIRADATGFSAEDSDSLTPPWINGVLTDH
jgi:hypothetical protein